MMVWSDWVGKSELMGWISVHVRRGTTSIISIGSVSGLIV